MGTSPQSANNPVELEAFISKMNGSKGKIQEQPAGLLEKTPEMYYTELLIEIRSLKNHSEATERNVRFLKIVAILSIAVPVISAAVVLLYLFSK